jgi:hypothetical protein
MRDENCFYVPVEKLDEALKDVKTPEVPQGPVETLVSFPRELRQLPHGQQKLQRLKDHIALMADETHTLQETLEFRQERVKAMIYEATDYEKLLGKLSLADNAVQAGPPRFYRDIVHLPDDEHKLALMVGIVHRLEDEVSKMEQDCRAAVRRLEQETEESNSLEYRVRRAKDQKKTDASRIETVAMFRALAEQYTNSSVVSRWITPEQFVTTIQWFADRLGSDVPQKWLKAIVNDEQRALTFPESGMGLAVLEIMYYELHFPDGERPEIDFPHNRFSLPVWYIDAMK